MAKKFSKRQLIDQNGFTAEEAALILEFQDKVPILFDNNGIQGFCVNARDLWKQLGESQGKFPTWVDRRFDKYHFVENVDYISFSQKCEKPQNVGGRPGNDYMLSIDMAKELSMIEHTEIGALARKYFILMEKAVLATTKWSIIREPLRKQYKEMQKALDAYMLRTVQRNADEWDYRIEADALNVIATGFKAQEIRNYVRCQDNVTRDSLTAIYNEYLLKLEEWNIIFLNMNKNRYERYKMLKEFFDVTFPNAVPLKDNADIQQIITNKEKLLNDTKEKMIKVA